MSLLIVGCGYVGMRVSKLWLDRGHVVHALTRSRERGEQLQRLGIEPVVGNWLSDESGALRRLPTVESILVAVPHRDDLGMGNSAQQLGLRRLLQFLPEGWTKLVYLSTTGVYGEQSGETVDEQTSVNPTRIAGEIAIRAERWLAEHVASTSYCVLRLAGIYGPGRLPLVETLRLRQPLAVPCDGYLNLIHVDDVARAISTLLCQKTNRPCYVLSDGHPVLREQFYCELAQLCGVDRPKFVQPDAESSRALRSNSSKRVNPRHFFEDFNFLPLFPDYREGLRHSLAARHEVGG